MSTRAPLPHILVIDDAPSILDPIGMLLGEEGYRVSVALAPPEPACLVDLAPDVIVQELWFGWSLEAGWNALTRMQLTPELARIPVILCTTASEQVAEPTMAASLNRLGVQVVLKPFMVEDLLSAVKDALTARKLLDQVRLVQDNGTVPEVSPAPEGGSASFS